MEKLKIENIISDIMINDGPDGHCDGADIIADFVEALQNGKALEWEASYFEKKKRYFTISADQQ